MGRSVLNLANLRKTLALFRDHRPGQIANTLRFAWHAARGFPTARLPYQPLCLVFFVTARCNLRCGQCRNQSPDIPSGCLQFADLSLESYERILDRYPRAIAVSLGGGEPLLHPRLFDIIRLAHERRMKVHMPTNGTLLPGRIDAILEAPLHHLNVSFYGSDRESFAGATGGDGALFDRMVEAVGELARRRRPGGFPRVLRASFICTKENLGRAADFVRLAERLGLDEVKLKNLFLFGIPGWDEALCLREGDPMVEEFFAELGRQGFRIPVFLPRLYRAGALPRRCRLPFTQLSVDGGGSIGPCCFVATWPRFGNAFDDPDAWNGPTLTEARRWMSDPATPLPWQCRHCEELIGGRTRLRH